MLDRLIPEVDRLMLTVAPSVAPEKRWLREEMASWAATQAGAGAGAGAGTPVDFEPDFARAVEAVQEGAVSVLVTGSFHTVGDALARMVGARAQALKKPIRWFSIPQLFRYERQQRGRLREHFQLNMDIIGEPGPAADAEIIAAAIDIARAFGLGPKDVRLRVSDRRIVTAQLAGRYHVSDGEMPGVLAGLDKWDRNPADAEAILRKVLPATDQRIGAILEFMSGLREDATELRSSQQAEPLNECVARLDEMKLSEFVEVDFRIVRGLAYYTGIVFELFDAKGSLRAICGGGRYGGLVQPGAGLHPPLVGVGP